MNPVDLRTVLVLDFLLSGVLGVVALVVARTFPREVRGPGAWAMGNVLLALGALLFALRGHAPGLLTHLGGHFCVMAGVAGHAVALCQFHGAPPPRRLIFLTMGLALPGVALATYVWDDHVARLNLLLLACALTYDGQARLLLDAWRRRRHHGALLILSYIVFMNLAVAGNLVLTLALDQPPRDLFEPNLALLVVAGGYSLFTVIANIGFVLMVNERLRDDLHRLATVDQLTGVLNRRALLDQLGADCALALRHGRPLAVLMMDLDHFKAVNDFHGHLVGDRVLAEVAALVAGRLRRGDSMGRYGGEEFLIVLRDTHAAGGLALAEDLRAAVAAHRLATVNGRLALTVSMGVAGLDTPCRGVDDLLLAADNALYRAKARRNAVQVARPEDVASQCHVPAPVLIPVSAG